MDCNVQSGDTLDIDVVTPVTELIKLVVPQLIFILSNPVHRYQETGSHPNLYTIIIIIDPLYILILTITHVTLKDVFTIQPSQKYTPAHPVGYAHCVRCFTEKTAQNNPHQFH